MKPPAHQADAALIRARRLLSDHRTMAKRDGVALPYTPADVRALIAGATTCAYCRQPVGWDVSLDHRTPTARGGKHELGNLLPCCARCNLLKGALTFEEFQSLLAVPVQLHPAARSDVERRLIAGGKRYATRRTRGTP